MDKTFVEKNDTHLIFKEADLDQHLTKAERDILQVLYEKVYEGRVNLGKKENHYYVVNKDEVYANDILEAIKRGEGLQGKSMPICLEDKIAYRLKDICDYRALYLVTMHYGTMDVEEIRSEDLVRNIQKAEDEENDEEDND